MAWQLVCSPLAVATSFPGLYSNISICKEFPRTLLYSNSFVVIKMRHSHMLLDAKSSVSSFSFIYLSSKYSARVVNCRRQACSWRLFAIPSGSLGSLVTYSVVSFKRSCCLFFGIFELQIFILEGKISSLVSKAAGYLYKPKEAETP